jgi:hypothetical protein
MAESFLETLEAFCSIEFPDDLFVFPDAIECMRADTYNELDQRIFTVMMRI